MRTLGKDLLGYETAILVDGHRPSGNPDLLIRLQAIAPYADGATAQPDVVHCQPVLAVSGKQLGIRLQFIRVIIDGFDIVVNHP